MADSRDFYKTAIEAQRYNLQQMNQAENLVKNAYLQIITTVFYELTTRKTSRLISEMCFLNKINFQVKNFQIEKFNVSSLGYFGTSFDMYAILDGLCVALSENLDTCIKSYEQYKNDIFQGQRLNYAGLKNLPVLLQTLDNALEKFLPQEKIVEKKVEPQILLDKDSKDLLRELNNIAKNRVGDDEKIIAAIKTVQKSMQDEVSTIQNSLKQILEIRDGIDFRTLEEPIYQLINLYKKIDGNLKRHPMADKDKGYSELIGRCNSFLKYIVQSLEMLGVEVISESGKTFDPDRNKVADEEPVSLNSVVSKVNKFGFAYKGKIIEKAEVEVKKAYAFGNFSGGTKK